MVGGSIVIIVTSMLVVILHLILIQKLGHIYVTNVNMPKIIHNLFHFYIFFLFHFYIPFRKSRQLVQQLIVLELTIVLAGIPIELTFDLFPRELLS